MFFVVFLRVENAKLNVGKKHNRYAYVQKVCSFRLKQSWRVKKDFKKWTGEKMKWKEKNGPQNCMLMFYQFRKKEILRNRRQKKLKKYKKYNFCLT